MSSESVIPLLFDTDIGSDIDDAVALAYLLCQPRCELVGVTTVSGNTAQRAALAEVLCREGGQGDVPVFAGLSGPILHGPGQPNVPQYQAITDLPHRTDYGPASDAVLFLRERIRSRPGELTLLAVGPMTNLGALFTLDPEIPALLKRLVLMCGEFSVEGLQPGSVHRDWNSWCDPVAAAVVYQCAAETIPGKLLSVGSNITEQCSLPTGEARARFARAGGALAVVAVWAEKQERLTFHDPLAAALIFEPSLCQLTTGTARAIADEVPHAGRTHWRAHPEGPHCVPVSVDTEAFFKHYFAICPDHTSPRNP